MFDALKMSFVFPLPSEESLCAYPTGTIPSVCSFLISVALLCDELCAWFRVPFGVWYP